jgi:uncharacterized protein with PIN domain
MQGLEEATCPSCSLVVKVIYNKVSESLGRLVRLSDESAKWKNVNKKKFWSEKKFESFLQLFIMKFTVYALVYAYLTAYYNSPKTAY